MNPEQTAIHQNLVDNGHDHLAAQPLGNLAGFHAWIEGQAAMDEDMDEDIYADMPPLEPAEEPFSDEEDEESDESLIGSDTEMG